MTSHDVCLELHASFGRTDAILRTLNISRDYGVIDAAAAANSRAINNNTAGSGDGGGNDDVLPSGGDFLLTAATALSADYGYSGTTNNNNMDDRRTLELVKFYLGSVVNPALAIFGVLGNLFSVLVLTRRRMKASMDCSMEQAAHTGLIALAVSDALYCVCTVLAALLSRSQTVFDGRTLVLYVQIFGPGLQNTFMHTSTWLTLIMAAGRYAAICRPLQARHLVGVNATRVAVAATFLFWIALELPSYWTFAVVEISCAPDNVTYILLDQGAFVADDRLKTAFTYVWATLGFFLPFLTLTYCNVHLIRALRESRRMRRFYRVSPKTATYGSRITPTMVAIVCMFLVLVTPSEVLHFYYYAVGEDAVELFNVAIIATNVLQTANFAFNFVLYCIVNVHFRETWKSLLCCCGWCCLAAGGSSLSARSGSAGSGGGGRRDSTQWQPSSSSARRTRNGSSNSANVAGAVTGHGIGGGIGIGGGKGSFAAASTFETVV